MSLGGPLARRRGHLRPEMACRRVAEAAKSGVCRWDEDVSRANRPRQTAQAAPRGSEVWRDGQRKMVEYARSAGPARDRGSPKRFAAHALLRPGSRRFCGCRTPLSRNSRLLRDHNALAASSEVGESIQVAVGLLDRPHCGVARSIPKLGKCAGFGPPCRAPILRCHLKKRLGGVYAASQPR